MCSRTCDIADLAVQFLTRAQQRPLSTARHDFVVWRSCRLRTVMGHFPRWLDCAYAGIMLGN